MESQVPQLHAEQREPPDLLLPRAAWACIVDHARLSMPKECCGALLGFAEPGGTRVSSVIPGRNIAPGDRTRSFQLDWDTLLQLTCEHAGTRDDENRTDGKRPDGARLVGFYHSHPDAPPVPSRSDRQGTWNGFACVIVGFPFDQPESIRAWQVCRPDQPFVSRRIVILG